MKKKKTIKKSIQPFSFFPTRRTNTGVSPRTIPTKIVFSSHPFTISCEKTQTVPFPPHVLFGTAVKKSCFHSFVVAMMFPSLGFGAHASVLPCAVYVNVC